MFLFAASVVLGLGYLITIPAPQSLAAVVPIWLVQVWALGLLFSGSFGIVAALWRGSLLVGLELERAALLLSTGALALIGGASFAANGIRAAFGGLIIVAWGAANIARCLQIRRDVRQLLDL